MILAIPTSHEATLRRLSDLLVRRHNLLILILLVPPMLWLGMVYLGSLFVFLAQSIFSIDEFSGNIVREPTLATLAELFRQISTY
jgi:putative spermidine/putrescine transport system permease protein